MIDWMAQADPPKEGSTFERMDGQLRHLSSKKKWRITLKKG